MMQPKLTSVIEEEKRQVDIAIIEKANPLSLIIVDLEEESKNKTLLRAMKACRQGLFDIFEIHALGTKNIQAAEDIICQMTRWIIIHEVYVGKNDEKTKGVLKVTF